MAKKSNIEWTGVTWNPLAGCSRISTGCENCYAEKMTKRLSAMGQPKYHGLLNGHGRFNGVVNFDENALILPLKTKKPETYFVNSMSDLFHENVQDEWIDQVFAVMALCPQHTFQILTKRPERMKSYLSDSNVWYRITDYAYLSEVARKGKSEIGEQFGQHFEKPLPNVWLGVSAENQEQASKRIPILLQTPAAIRWVSAEPLLSGIEFVKRIDSMNHVDMLKGIRYWKGHHVQTVCKLDWIVAGGESGANSRPCELAWIRSIVEQCNAASVPVFVKQLGSKPICERLIEFHSPVIKLKNKKGGNIEEFPEDLQIREFPTSKN